MDKENENDLEVKEAQVDYNKRYTFADYMSWEDDIRRELIDGVPYLMSAPTNQHQRILVNLVLVFGNFLKGKKCRVFPAPHDVRLNAETTDDTVVQPDLVILCDKSKLMKTGTSGAPDMTVEILSPSTKSRDKNLKYQMYEKTSVREYWIIDPELKILEANILIDGKYVTKIYANTEKAPVHILDGFEVDLDDVFAE